MKKFLIALTAIMILASVDISAQVSVTYAMIHQLLH